MRAFGSRCRKRRTSSSINVVFPAPPGPVKPITLAARCSSFDVRRLRSTSDVLFLSQSRPRSRSVRARVRDPHCDLDRPSLCAACRNASARNRPSRSATCRRRKSYRRPCVFIRRASSCVIVPPPPPKTAMSSAPWRLQLPNDFGKKIDVPAVVTGNADGRDILLDRRADDIADIAMKPEINDLDPVPDEFEIDRVDRAVVPVADRDSGENADR